MIKTDVLVAGSGPAGLTMAAMLADQGVRVLTITKHRRLAPTPRAHVTNQRTFEILRELGIENEAIALATEYKRMPDQIFMRSLSGPEFARIKGLGEESTRHGDAASPCALHDLPQNLLEPLLFAAAADRGAQMRFDMELLAFAQDEEGVTADVVDRLSGKRSSVRARYLVGADGGRSVVAAALDLPFVGAGEIGGSLNITFEADLSQYIEYRPSLLLFMVRSAADRGGPGLSILRCVRPWTHWLFIKGYSPDQATSDLSTEQAIATVREDLGLPDLEVRITASNRWTMNALAAARYQHGRVFCVGDAVHRHVPSNGLGSNTAIQDSYNLAWKLALAFHGKAGSALLESYSAERVPVGQQVVARATKSLESYGPILEAVGALDETGEAMREIAADTSAGLKRRERLRAAVGNKVYEFQARGVELNQFYRSSAILDEGQLPSANARDAELFYHPTTCPGARLPHAWVQRKGRTLSTLDLVGRGRFTVVTGVGGKVWLDAAGTVSAQMGVDIAGVAIGPGCVITDYAFEWTDRREISESGCLLVRPDGHIAWRCMTVIDSASEQLLQAMKSILDRLVSG